MKTKFIFMSAVALYTFLVLPMVPILADEITLEQSSPVIQHEPPGQSAPVGKALRIEATIRDKAGIKDATVFYRKSGEDNYQQVKMESQGNDLYSATIPADGIKEPGVEYYIQASDKAGNIVMRGFSFSPLSLSVTRGVPAPQQGTPLVLTPSPEERMTMKSEAPAVEGEKPWYKKWWVWTLAGAVVIGAAAGGGGGGGGGGSSPGAGAGTGSATISGPTP
jgi:hypothetical protein